MTVAMKSVVLLLALIAVANAQFSWWSFNPIKCWECHNARTNAACLANGRLRQCDYNQGSCQNTIRVNHGRVRITKTCKQTQACMNNQRQNNQRAWLGLQCNIFPQNIVCRCCCQTDECNDKALYCRGPREQAAMRGYETNQPKQESQQGQQRQTNNNDNRNNANDNTNQNNHNNYGQPKSQNPCHTGTPCGNGATCVVGDGHQYTCQCAEGFTDSHCNTPVKKAGEPREEQNNNNNNDGGDDSNNNDNANNDNINKNEENYNNQLADNSQAGFEGPHPGGNPCDTGMPCGNGGTCVAGEGRQYTCQCPDGWGDANCNTPIKSHVAVVPVRPLEGYIGCFKDGLDPGRDLAPYFKESESMTVEMCAEYCGNNGSPYFGLQYKVQCWCSAANWDPENPTYGKVDDSECKHACSGDATQLCGATWRQAVYKTADVSGAEESETEESETDESDESEEAVPPPTGEEAVPPPAEEETEYKGVYDDWVTSDCQRPSEGECSEEFSCCNKKKGIRDITRACKGPGECNPNKEHTKQKDCILKCVYDELSDWEADGICHRPESGRCAAVGTCCGEKAGLMIKTRECLGENCKPGSNLRIENPCKIGCKKEEGAGEGEPPAPPLEDPCDDAPCSNGATCLADGETFSCECAAGYHGPLCKEEHIRGETCWVEGEQFAGTTVDTTANGKKCDPWSMDHSGWHYYDDAGDYNNKWYDPFYVDVDESTAGSWCRNYKSDPNGPYCFVGAVEISDEDVKVEVLKGNILTTQDHFEYCDIPKCPPLNEAGPPPVDESEEAAPPSEDESEEAVPPPEEEAVPPPEEDDGEWCTEPLKSSQEATDFPADFANIGYANNYAYVWTSAGGSYAEVAAHCAKFNAAPAHHNMDSIEARGKIIEGLNKGDATWESVWIGMEIKDGAWQYIDGSTGDFVWGSWEAANGATTPDFSFDGNNGLMNANKGHEDNLKSSYWNSGAFTVHNGICEIQCPSG